MGSYRFLLSRRWLLFAVAVALSAYAAWWLGEWQFGRLHDRRADNAIVRANLDREPAPVEDVLAPGRPVDDREEWRRVVATGTYDVDDTVVVRYRSGEDGEPGVGVVVPLVTANGTALVVDRGFFATDERRPTPDEVPAAPTGQVTVTGWVRVDGTGSSTTVDVTDAGLSTRAISSQDIGSAIGRPVFGGFVDALTEDPAADAALQLRDPPDLGSGPHFFYGLQWWFFGVLAVFGFGYLAYDERKRGPRGERPHRQRPARERRTNVPAAYRRDGSAEPPGPGWR